MSEAKLWKKLKAAAVGSGLKLTRHECAITRGTPDVSFTDGKINGWIELKYIPKVPVRLSARPLAGKLSIEQIGFLESRPNTLILVEIGGKNGGFWIFQGEEAGFLDEFSWKDINETRESSQTLAAIITEAMLNLHVKM